MNKVFEQLFEIPDNVTHDESHESFLNEVKKTLSDTDSFEHLDAFPEHIRDQAIFRWKVVSKANELCDGVLSNQRLTNIYPELQLEFAEKTPSVSSMKRWNKAYNDSGRAIRSLIPSISERGNKARRMGPDMEGLIQQALDRIKDTRAGAVTSAYGYLQHLVLQFNRSSGLNLKPPSLQAFWARYKKISPYDIAVKQKGKFRANKEFKHIGTMVKTNRLLERVEIDHTKLDFFVVEKDNQHPLGRPYITTLCDTHTRSVLGFYIGFTPPSYVSVARALKHSLLSKDYVQTKYPDIKHTWMCFGKPELIVSDNGKEFDDNDFKLALNKLMINSGKNPTATPYLKPVIERYFGKLNSELLRAQPGHTLASLKGSTGYNPAKNAVIDMDRLQHLVHIWICDIHQAGPNSKRDRIPNLLWTKAMKKFEPRQVDYDADDLTLVFCRTLNSKLRRDGIKYKNLRYSNNALAELRGQLGDHVISFKIDPENLGYIYVSNKLNKTYLKVAAVEFEYASSVTLHQHKINCLNARKEVGNNYDEADILEANSLIHQLVEEAISAKRSPNKRVSHLSKAARYLEDSKVAKAKATSQEPSQKVITSTSDNEKASSAWSTPIDTSDWER